MFIILPFLRSKVLCIFIWCTLIWFQQQQPFGVVNQRQWLLLEWTTSGLRWKRKFHTFSIGNSTGNRSTFGGIKAADLHMRNRNMWKRNFTCFEVNFNLFTIRCEMIENQSKLQNCFQAFDAKPKQHRVFRSSNFRSSANNIDKRIQFRWRNLSKRKSLLHNRRFAGSYRTSNIAEQ